MLPVVVPPLAVQAEILGRLQETQAPVDAAISRFHREIELLREYRARLIADVVTGRLDVREAAAQLPKDATASLDAEPANEADDPELIDEEAAEA